MESGIPLRLLGIETGGLFVFNSRERNVDEFDILSYRWGAKVAPYKCGLPGVDWDVEINPLRLFDIRRLMESAGIKYLWVDSLCIRQTRRPGETDNAEKAAEIGRMQEYYKTARTCHVLLEMKEAWDSQRIGSDLKFIDHILDHMTGAALSSEAYLTEGMVGRLSSWTEQRDWYFRMDRAAVDAGVLNCYAACVSHVRLLYENLYFARVWTFQEMLLGKNITMWAVNDSRVALIGRSRRGRTWPTTPPTRPSSCTNGLTGAGR